MLAVNRNTWSFTRTGAARTERGHGHGVTVRPIAQLGGDTGFGGPTHVTEAEAAAISASGDGVAAAAAAAAMQSASDSAMDFTHSDSGMRLIRGLR